MEHGDFKTTRFSSFTGYNQKFANKTIPQVFPNQWVRSCLALSTQSGLLQWVVDGQLVEDTMLDSLKEAAANRPSDLTDKLIIGRYSFSEGWFSPSIQVTNLNIFSSMLSIERMVGMTSGEGEECWEEGDYLAWREAQWTLHGEAHMEEVESELGRFMFDGRMK